jgi:hypothetical protein
MRAASEHSNPAGIAFFTGDLAASITVSSLRHTQDMLATAFLDRQGCYSGAEIIMLPLIPDINRSQQQTTRMC